MSVSTYPKVFRDGQWVITVYLSRPMFLPDRYHWTADLDDDLLCQSLEPSESEDEALLDAVNAIRLKTADLIGG